MNQKVVYRAYNSYMSAILSYKLCTSGDTSKFSPAILFSAASSALLSCFCRFCMLHCSYDKCVSTSVYIGISMSVSTKLLT